MASIVGSIASAARLESVKVGMPGGLRCVVLTDKHVTKKES